MIKYKIIIILAIVLLFITSIGCNQQNGFLKKNIPLEVFSEKFNAKGQSFFKQDFISNPY